MAGLALTACSGDEETIETKTLLPNKTYTLTVNASKGNDEAASRMTRALSLVDNTLSASWATTERVYVLEGTGTLTPSANAKTVKLNGGITGISGVLPLDLTLQFPRKEVDYTGQVGTIADIAAKYDYATAVANIDKIEGENISATAPVTFTNQQAIVKFTLKDRSSNLINASWLRVSACNLKQTGVAAGDITITPASATSEIFAALKDINGSNILMLTAKVGDNYYVYTKDNVTFTNGEYKTIGVPMYPMTYPQDLDKVDAKYIGSVVGQNGKVYPDAAAATAAGTTAVAMIAYVSDKGHNLAVALADESGTMNQEAAGTACSSKTTVTGGTWRLPTVLDWKNMLIGCGNGASSSDIKMNYTCFNAKLATVNEGAVLQNDWYWTSADFGCVSFNNITNADFSMDDPSGEGLGAYYVRAVLAF